jgi:hypothetical protein
MLLDISLRRHLMDIIHQQNLETTQGLPEYFVWGRWYGGTEDKEISATEIGDTAIIVGLPMIADSMEKMCLAESRGPFNKQRIEGGITVLTNIPGCSKGKAVKGS